VTRSLLAAGVLLVSLGIAIFGVLAATRIDRAGRTPLVGEEQGRLDPPSRLWSFAGGLVLAAGAGCIGLGMNQWKQAGRPAPRGR
jgi:hypothetical protein